MKQLTLLLAGSFILIAGCSYRSVYTDYDLNATFAGVTTFAWAEVGPAARDSKYRSSDPLLEKRIHRAVEDGLSTKGMTLVRGGANPDLLIDAFLVTARTRQAPYRAPGYFGMGYGGWPPSTGVYAASTVSHWSAQHVSSGIGYPRIYGYDTRYNYGHGYLNGAVVVEMFNAAGGEMVWRGWSNESIRPNLSPEDSDKLVRNAVQKILKEFPPES